MSIEQVAQDTRISPRFLEALEAEQFHELPAPVYVRGFLRSYANYLRIDPQPLLDRLIGGDNAAPGASEGYVGANGHSSSRRRTDPFQRNGVVVAAPVGRAKPAAQPGPADDDGWAPEPLKPFSPPATDHGYIPGSDLMEAPEHPVHTEYREPEPIYRRRTAGVLAERPAPAREPGLPRGVLLVAAGVGGVLVFLLLAIFLTRGGGDDSSPAAATDNRTPAVTPGTVISLTTATAGAAGPATTGTAATASPSASATGTPAPGEATAQPTTVPGVAATPTPVPQATQAAPTATPTSPPTPTPTATPIPTVVAASLNFGECQATAGSYDCGPGPYRIVCFAPISPVYNRNWWVDVNWDFGPLPSGLGWREKIIVVGDNGDILDAGAGGCN